MQNQHPHPRRSDFSRWHFDIDAALNPYLPAPPWRWLPRPISHFLGYRGDHPPRALGNLVIAFWSLIGAFCGVLVVAEASKHVSSFQQHHAPVIIASFVGAPLCCMHWFLSFLLSCLLTGHFRVRQRCWSFAPSNPPLLNREMPS